MIGEQFVRESGAGVALFDTLLRNEGQVFVSLDTARELLERLGNPHERIPTVHVAGTNGKGSVSAMIAAILRNTAAPDGSLPHVGQTSSPHLTHVSERCLIDGKPVSTELMNESLERVIACAQAGGLPLSYFVLALCASYLEFVRAKLDWMVVEVGLGGIYDATNLMRAPKACVITGISRDHAELLGESDPDRARNKAGIAKPGVPLFVGRVPSEVRAAIEETAASRGAPVHFLGEDFSFHYRGSDQRGVVAWDGEEVELSFGRFALRGAHQLENAALAARVVAELGSPAAAMNRGIEQVRWPGRFERCFTELGERGSREVILDVAHNVGGFAALLATLTTELSIGRRSQPPTSIIFLCSILGRKEWREMLRLIDVWRVSTIESGCRVEVVCTDSGYPGAVAPQELAACIPTARVAEDAGEAFALATELGDSRSLIVVTGSSSLVGLFRPRLSDAPFRSIATPECGCASSDSFG